MTISLQLGVAALGHMTCWRMTSSQSQVKRAKHVRHVLSAESCTGNWPFCCLPAFAFSFSLCHILLDLFLDLFFFLFGFCCVFSLFFFWSLPVRTRAIGESDSVPRSLGPVLRGAVGQAGAAGRSAVPPPVRGAASSARIGRAKPPR